MTFEEERPGFGHISMKLALHCIHVIWNFGQRIDLIGSENKSKLINETHTVVQHPRPPRPIRMIANTLVTTILRSPWHGLRSNQLLLLTFTGRKSGKEFTTPIRYTQEGETLCMTVVYPWWKNLLENPAVRVLLRGEMRPGIAEVTPEQEEEVVVKIHLEG